MRFIFFYLFSSLLGLGVVQGKILADTPGLAAAPSVQQTTTSSLNLADIQGDILVGQIKKQELFYFVQITDVKTFKAQLRSAIAPLITSTKQLSNNTVPALINIGFSHTGIKALGIDPKTLNDADFANGMLSDVKNLGDDANKNWLPAFKSGKIDVAFLIASDTTANVNQTLKRVQVALKNSTMEQYRLNGAIRPGDQEGHEHFGFLDGISQPAVSGFVQTPLPGQLVVPPGVILTGEANDTTTRPSWAKDGSFFVFRQLEQFVPEFNKFVNDNPLNVSGLTRDQNVELFGARLIGRWNSGAPLPLSPLVDDDDLGADKMRNNNFDFARNTSDTADPDGQVGCPFSAHIRHIRPRLSLGNNFNNIGQIFRSSIPYGPEVSASETKSNVSNPALERGLAFVAYQSTLSRGFKFVQETWANNANFPTSNTGVDPIISTVQDSKGNRVIFGTNPQNLTQPKTLVKDFVVSRGGEYFFSPSISALKTTLSA